MPDETLQSLLHRAAFAPLPGVGWLRVTGEDRVRWLNGMTTNSIQDLQPGQGCYTFFLNAQGRIQGDATAWMRADDILLETAVAGSLATMLDHFIIMDDVELEVLTLSEQQSRLPHDRSGPPSSRAGVSLIGLEAMNLLAKLEFTSPTENQFVTMVWQGEPVELFHQPSAVVSRFEFWSDPATVGLLTQALRAAGVAEATPAALEQLRILEGTPLFGIDIRDKDLPQETAPMGTQSRALHFSKGCYLGQEIVERIHSRGNLHRTFSGFRLQGEMPPPGTALAAAEAPDKAVGELTSIAQVGADMLALGYIRREALERGAALTYPGGTATPVALPHKIPAPRPADGPPSASE